MRSALRFAITLVGCLLFGTSQGIDFPPLADRYANIPEEAEDAYKSLKRLEARTEIGVNYHDYNRVIGDTFPDVKLFLESREAKNLPELAFVLANAMDCYREVDRLWGIKISSDDASEKYKASITLITAQPILWRVATTNLSGAKAIIQSEPGELEAAQKLIAAGSDSLTLEGGLQAAIDAEIHLGRASRAKETGCPVPNEVVDGDLEGRVFPDGKIDESYAAGAMTKRMPPIFSKVPPASEEGSIQVLKNGERQGLVTVFRFNDPAITNKAFEALTRNLSTSSRKLHAGLGNLAMVSEGGAVFRRGDVVVYTQGSMPQDAMLSMLTAIDRRITESFGASTDIAPTSGATATPPAAATAPMPLAVQQQYSLAAHLFKEGDLGEEVAALRLADSPPSMLSEIGGATATATVDFDVDGQAKGFVTGMVFANIDSAEDAYKTIAKGLDRSASTVDGLGAAAKVAALPGIEMCDILFRVDSTVILARCPTPDQRTAIAFARRIERRLAGDEAEGNTAVEEGDGAKLASLLLADGDLARGVEPGAFNEHRHAEFEGLPAPIAGGTYALTAAGSPFGTIAGLEYENLEAARDIFIAWTSKTRVAAKVTRVTGLGAKSYRRETGTGVELYVWRDRFLLFVSGPLSSDKDLVRLARRADARIRDARSAAKAAATADE